MPYFNYHAKAKKLIAEGHLTSYEIVDCWNNTLIREAQNLLGVGTPNNNGTSRPLRPKNP